MLSVSQNDVPAEIVARAESKLLGFMDLKKEINSRFLLASKSLDEFRNFITDLAVNRERNPIGYLTQNLQAYLDCLSLDEAQLTELLRQDEGHWTETLDKAKQEAQSICGSLQ